MAMESSNDPKLRILFFPFMAPGHMLPMVDLAKLFAARAGVEATIFTTPANAASIERSIRHTAVRLHVVPFPSVDPGHHQGGRENFSREMDGDSMKRFLASVSLLRDPFDAAVRALAPDAVVTDMSLPWTVDVAAEHGVPRLVFSGANIFNLCMAECINPLKDLPAPEQESFLVPGLPHQIRMLKSWIAVPLRPDMFHSIREANGKSHGEVVNSFYELEPDYVDYYRSSIRRRAWTVGPVTLCSGSMADRSTGGSKSLVDSEAVVNWLDGQTPASVVYVCFGSLGEFTVAQTRELASALESSGRPFVWVVGVDGSGMPEGFEERNRERGLVIRGWAPQTLILDHNAVGCFMTHCGWNSSLEAISAGLPMVTWPLFADQFNNERLIVDVLRIGVAVGIRKNAWLPEEREVVEAAKIATAVNEVMDVWEEAEERRRRARELAGKARRAVEDGGSSDVMLGDLLLELRDRRKNV